MEKLQIDKEIWLEEDGSNVRFVTSFDSGVPGYELYDRDEVVQIVAWMSMWLQEHEVDHVGR